MWAGQPLPGEVRPSHRAPAPGSEAGGPMGIRGWLVDPEGRAGVIGAEAIPAVSNGGFGHAWEPVVSSGRAEGTKEK